MNFIEAVIKISKRKDMQLCTDETELTGEYPSICVYRKDEFVGKLHWPKDGNPAWVDEILEGELKYPTIGSNKVFKD